ncbi:MAG: hypothetical protein K1X57_04130 [Gemmataceae bacterium]|nr:hypothetical protein [Gemmataceae bacterium]
MAEERPEAEKEAEEKTYLGMTLGDITKVVLGVLLGGIATLVLGWWNTKSPHLTVNVSDTILFKGDRHNFGIVNCTVANDGSREAESLECTFNIQGAIIQDLKVSPDHLNAVVPNRATMIGAMPRSSEDTARQPNTKKGDKITVTMPLLNVGETINISVLLADSDDTASKPQMSVRGKGVIGEKAPPRRRTDSELILLFVSSGALCTCIATLCVVFIERIRRRKVRELTHSQFRHYLLMRKHGLLRANDGPGLREE